MVVLRFYYIAYRADAPVWILLTVYGHHKAIFHPVARPGTDIFLHKYQQGKEHGQQPCCQLNGLGDVDCRHI